jgi:hypothetical protein
MHFVATAHLCHFVVMVVFVFLLFCVLFLCVFVLPVDLLWAV